MWKPQLSEKDLLKALTDTLRTRLPSSWSLRLEEQPSVADGRPDALLIIDAPNGDSGTLVVETTIGLPPARVTQVVQKARSYKLGPAMVVSSFVSPTAQRILTEQGASYADTTGNLRIALERPALFIDIKGADRSPWPDTRAIRSLKGPGASRVVRALADYRPPYTLSKLSGLADASLGTVYRVLDFLEAEALLQREPPRNAALQRNASTAKSRGAVTAVDWAGLLRRWSENYSLTKSNITRNFLAPRGVPDLVDRVRRWKGRVGRVVITGSLAAAQLISSAPPRLAVLLVDDIPGAAKELELREADAGANAILVKPFDEVLFARNRIVEEIVYAAPSQVVVDLLTSPGRGPSEAEDLLLWMKGNESAWRS